MKLESFNGKKFEVVSDDAMSFVVGGYYDRSQGGQTSGGLHYSNDYVKDGVNHYSDNAASDHDWSRQMMNRFCGEQAISDGHPVPDPLPGEQLWPEWSQFHAIDFG